MRCTHADAISSRVCGRPLITCRKTKFNIQSFNCILVRLVIFSSFIFYEYCEIHFKYNQIFYSCSALLFNALNHQQLLNASSNDLKIQNFADPQTIKLHRINLFPWFPIFTAPGRILIRPAATMLTRAESRDRDTERVTDRDKEKDKNIMSVMLDWTSVVQQILINVHFGETKYVNLFYVYCFGRHSQSLTEWPSDFLLRILSLHSIVCDSRQVISISDSLIIHIIIIVCILKNYRLGSIHELNYERLSF